MDNEPPLSSICVSPPQSRFRREIIISFALIQTIADSGKHRHNSGEGANIPKPP
jgi:hypothetical protein